MSKLVLSGLPACDECQINYHGKRKEGWFCEQGVLEIWQTIGWLSREWLGFRRICWVIPQGANISSIFSIRTHIWHNYWNLTLRALEKYLENNRRDQIHEGSFGYNKVCLKNRVCIFMHQNHPTEYMSQYIDANYWTVSKHSNGKLFSYFLDKLL